MRAVLCVVQGEAQREWGTLGLEGACVSAALCQVAVLRVGQRQQVCEVADTS